MTVTVQSKSWELPVVNGRRYSDPANVPSQPALGDAGWTVVGDDNVATATTVVFDLRQDYTDSTMLWVTNGPFSSGEAMLRAATYEYAPTDGYWGSGCGIFRPGSWEIDPDRGNGQHVCGLGSLDGFDDLIGGLGCRQICVGQLMMYGSTYLTAVTPESCKDLIIARLGDSGPGGRPMLIPKIYGAGGDVCPSPCDDEVCNSTLDPVGDPNFFNDPPNAFDLRDYYNQWVWIELQADLDTDEIRTKIWTADGVHNGTLIAVQDYSNSGTAGSLPGLIQFNFVNSDPVGDANCFKKITWARMTIGDASDQGPPLGFGE